jgi:PAS domain S-box-containing protein
MKRYRGFFRADLPVGFGASWLISCGGIDDHVSPTTMKEVRVSKRWRYTGSVFAAPFVVCSLVLISGLILTNNPASAAPPPALAEPEKTVLILDTFSFGDQFDSLDTLEATVRAHTSARVNFQVERLEAYRFGEGFDAGLIQTLRHSYQGQKLDLVVAHHYPALQFVSHHRREVFEGVPVVFMDVASLRLQNLDLASGITGVTSEYDIRSTLDLALRLSPDTKNVAVIGANSTYGQLWLDRADEELRLHADTLNDIDLVGLPPAQLLEKVSTLPPHTVVLFLLVPASSSQPAIPTTKVLEDIARRFPTYCVNDHCFDYGVVGGVCSDTVEHETKTGEIVARVLSGENATHIPVVHDAPDYPCVDWRQLRHWHISEAALPAGSGVLHRQPSVWDLYRKYIVAAAVVILLQSVLIAGLLWQRLRKRKAEAALRENEERLRVMSDAAPSLIWTSDKDGNVTYQNDKRLDFSTSSSDASLGEKWTKYIHPDDLPGVLDANATAYRLRSGFSKEYRLRRRDGVYRWMYDLAVPRINSDGTFCGFIGSAVDITDQKLAQEALEKLSGKLIDAQEQERSRIARELHDDISQRLALLSLNLERVYSGSDVSDSHRNVRMLEIQRHCAEIATDVQALSHELHSSKLDHLGLVAAIRGFCAEFSKLKNVNVQFSDENVPYPMSKEISLCLFRVAQEALHNALKHSGARNFAVNLRGTPRQVQLEVRDWGVGFNKDAKSHEGLGLVSMQERIHLVHGTFRIESQPKQGTAIIATVQLAAGNNKAASASGASA